ncbi:hypothetical protein [Streptosporangium canum]|uniref:hypothetical protein n=1 Tax=Streptosporangium canum TaxID=324952 RepID=UPI00378B8BEF
MSGYVVALVTIGWGIAVALRGDAAEFVVGVREPTRAGRRSGGPPSAGYRPRSGSRFRSGSGFRSSSG